MQMANPSWFRPTTPPRASQVTVSVSIELRIGEAGGGESAAAAGSQLAHMARPRSKLPSIWALRVQSTRCSDEELVPGFMA
jgi:hypothetical protein